MKKIIVTLGLIGILVGLTTADALLTKEVFTKKTVADVPAPQPPKVDDPSMPPANTDPTEPRVEIREQSILDIVDASPLEYREKEDTNLLSKLVTDDTPVQTVILLKNGDRAGSLTWIESSRVKVYYLAMKEALHSAFSAEIRDLIDETQSPPGKPTRNLFSFIDPAFGDERLVFVRRREKLLEFHISEGYDDDVFGLMNLLTQ